MGTVRTLGDARAFMYWQERQKELAERQALSRGAADVTRMRTIVRRCDYCGGTTSGRRCEGCGARA